MDTLRTYERLVACGVGEAQARCFVQTLWSVTKGEYDYEMAQANLVDSGFTHVLALLFARVIEDGARAAGAVPGAPRWGFTKNSGVASP
jgi:hypothetical protein